MENQTQQIVDKVGGDVSLLLGAGASAANDLPTMISFIKRAFGEEFFTQLHAGSRYHFGSQDVTQRASNRLSILRRLMQVAGLDRGQPAYDLEDVFGYLHKSGLLRSNRKEMLALFWFYTICHTQSNSPFDQSLQDFRGQEQKVNQWLSDIDDAVKDLRRKMNEVFLVRAKNESVINKAHENYQTLLKVFGTQPRAIFTTNFDTVFEALAESKRFPGRLIDGIAGEPVRTFNFGHYLSQPSTSEQIYLFKLHGSVTWEREIETIVDCYPKVPDTAVVAEPVISKNPEEFPFTILYDIFQKVLDKNRVCIAIGFSFRDDKIRNMVTKRLNAQSPFKLIIVAPEEAQRSGTENLNVHLANLEANPNVSWLKRRFGEAETTEAILKMVQ